MSSKSLWLLLACAACGGADDPATTTPPADPAAVADGGAPAATTPVVVKKKLIVDTGTVAAPGDLVRETYNYSFSRAARDPFAGLMTLVDTGPELPDLRLVSLIYNHSDPKQSLVTFRDIGNKKQYSIRPGDRIGRLVLVSVDTEEATLRVNDYGTIREQKYTVRPEGNP